MKVVESGSLLALAWKDKRVVYHLTNYFKPTRTVLERRKEGGGFTTIHKPDMNKFYSSSMKGTDVMSQRESYYTAERRTVRWPKGSWW
jgi:hypothetical protein